VSAKQRLGRGLDSLIPTDFAGIQKGGENKPQGTEQIDVNKIANNPLQPRSEFAPDQIKELADSIKEHGIIQPLVVSKKGDSFQLIAGERRLRAAKIAGLKKVPVLIRSADKQQQLEVAIVENVQRSDLSALELAEAYMQLNTQFNLSNKQIAQKVGKAETTVINTMRLLNLVYEAKKALSEGKISVAHAKAIASSHNPQKQLAMLKVILEKNLASNEAEELARRLKKQNLSADKAVGVQSYNQSLQDKLADALSTKIILRKSARGGRIIIEFYGDEELDRITKQILS
jgi:ParB family chromosome partitioning protein